MNVAELQEQEVILESIKKLTGEIAGNLRQIVTLSDELREVDNTDVKERLSILQEIKKLEEV